MPIGGKQLMPQKSTVYIYNFTAYVINGRPRNVEMYIIVGLQEYYQIRSSKSHHVAAGARVVLKCIRCQTL